MSDKKYSKNQPYDDFQYDTSNVLLDSRLPTLIWVILIYFSVLISHIPISPKLVEFIFFTGLILIHMLLHWYASSIVDKRPLLYFMTQGIIVWGCALLMSDDYSAIFTTLTTGLLGQSIGVFFQRRKMLLVGIIYYTLFSVSFVWFGPSEVLASFLPSLIVVMVIVISYASLFYKQVRVKLRTQLFLRELERAHRKVEELTIANERQRMARDLHDTLAQGLAGLIMQLDAVDAHLENGNMHRAHEIVQLSKAQAKRTLSEARSAIDDLRANSAEVLDLSKAVQDEAERFSHATGVHISTQLSNPHSVSKLIIEHSLHIIRECLANTAKYAMASNVEILVATREDAIELKITDDGIGFATKLIGKQSGRYGLIGLYERARIIGGDIKIESGKKGTQVSVRIPLQQEDTIL
ncbi:histidine kinase [Paenibacillus baekrokdamisoli]|uniref:histidine kinase n=1 Tax=Paenibacillus baekrokdamisoli TaxID=1712516 RepID=A0A3G9J1D8_9BACL|nr:sensor histidine kinase [Paenibacillus baekrokdamisoli]MBB3072810.1 NarL family two-component system sensor histidine kinase YdfH [Paenibacillus baekrokdamisoli]BBH24372.1 histidine kinase [Paenibacillus baekrokdamisoli]